jgi:hypothetical protein
MPLPTPILDDRSWQQLRDELVRRIPVYNPEWTDHNPSDPGITLLELFAYLGETLLFRFNQIPEATRLEFLRLLRVPMRPAVPAQAMVALSVASPAEVLVPIGTETRAGSVSFETDDEVCVFPLTARAVRKETSPAPTGEEAKIYADAAIEARDLGPGEVPVYYVSDVLPDDPSVPGFAARDFGATVDGILWVAVLKTKDTDLKRLADGILNLGFIPDPVVLDMEDVEGCPGAGSDTPTDEVSWEISTAEPRNGKPFYQPLVVAGDTTRGLSRQGVVRLRLPHDPLTGGVPAFDDPDLEGTGDLPPVLDDEELTADLLYWIRGYRRKAGRPLGRVLWVGANASSVTQVRTARTELLGTGNGNASQAFTLTNHPVVAGSLELQVEEEGGWTPWTEVDDFAGWGRDDRVFVVDPEAGEVRFGNGTTGKAPQIGERVRASTYRYGGGVAGNVAAKAITKVSGVAGVKASNPRRAYGGADAESVAEAVERIPGELRRHDRAVTASDFRELALQAPGAGVGRAEVLPRFHPPTKQTEAAGIVTVVVWPTEDLANPNAPMPDRDLLQCVCAWLDARRLVTTELYVIPPTYRKVAVAVGVVVKPGYGIEAVNAWVELVIRQYLAPLPPYGPSGGGWPLGRRVHGPELSAAALQVDGVEYLEGLDVSGWVETTDADGNVTGQWVKGTVELEDWEVVELTDITVVKGPPLEPGVGVTPPVTPVDDGTGTGTTGTPVPVPIPTLKEEC